MVGCLGAASASAGTMQHYFGGGASEASSPLRAIGRIRLAWAGASWHATRVKRWGAAAKLDAVSQ